MNSKTTIGKFAEKNGMTVSNFSYWTVMRSANGTYASIRLRTHVIGKDGRVYASKDFGEVLRTRDFPHEAEWRDGSTEVQEANDLKLEAMDFKTDRIEAHRFWGMDHAMPWEVTPAKKTVWGRIVALIRR